MTTTTRVKLYPTEGKKTLLERGFGSCGFVYNNLIVERYKYYITCKDPEKFSLDCLDAQRVESNPTKAITGISQQTLTQKSGRNGHLYEKTLLRTGALEPSYKTNSNFSCIKGGAKRLYRIYNQDKYEVAIDRDTGAAKIIASMNPMTTRSVLQKPVLAKITSLDLYKLYTYGQSPVAKAEIGSGAFRNGVTKYE
ncbi:MAG: helix-turn-helix domain-containing protein [Nitrososphaerota archaeon]|jgi:hypothetical protein|nr:helix-turn-helix domain-containing protein [Nitrososphaerota archaeon]MDG6927217.1 helix-turn-helix domain-containing protein [Nitrososphaerota archaeon]MDG6929725.1 helix-turn-helix domain-containing protein [Nitrososphaerota archaeon]MDG6932660.1 helix-turn-helix domain-containing protein [Nitrososphaerota archaeon]MDG6936118.1 helix-turn-helix domain-containing protein [Nitrososphaerota archaeon]